MGVFALALQCGLLVDPGIIEAIVRVESGGNPNALAVNGDVELVRQPRDRAEAVAMARWLERHGYNFDSGLAQVNSANLAWLGLDAESVFDPCANLRAAARVLEECHGRALRRWGAGERAITAALSCYNTGDFTRGLANGYVDAVRAKAPGPLLVRLDEAIRAADAQERPIAPHREMKERVQQVAPRRGRQGLPAARPKDAFAASIQDAFDAARKGSTRALHGNELRKRVPRRDGRAMRGPGDEQTSKGAAPAAFRQARPGARVAFADADGLEDAP